MTDIRQTIRETNLLGETVVLQRMVAASGIDEALRGAIHTRAVDLVHRIRKDSDPSMMELFLGEYGMSSEEGVALMCLAEALLRVPDPATMDDLIEDKIAPSAWGAHLGKSHSSLVNASTWALFMTGKVLDDDKGPSVQKVLHGAIKRLGEPVIRQAVTRVMKELGRNFVLGETIQKAMERAKVKEKDGFTYSYDMLGEAARTDRDAKRYHMAYADAIAQIAKGVKGNDMRTNPGISIKLSALHPRYETLKRDRVMDELMPRARSLAALAKSAGIGLNIDAEEAGRLDLSLDVIEALLADPNLRGWDGFGVVVQAYSLRAGPVLDWLYALATRLDRKIMVRLVKGAYWDTEIKLAQVEGHAGFPVFTRKSSTDVSYICCAKKLLGMTDRIYPQFATHNAHTVAAILEMSTDRQVFEFQRLHGMGEALHDTVHARQHTRCRIYAPVGAHKDLLAYLVRRLLENGANSSFVNQIVDEDVPAEAVAADPFAFDLTPNPVIDQPCDLFQPQRLNSKGWDLTDPVQLATLEAGIAKFDPYTWQAKGGSGTVETVMNPATGASVGTVPFCTAQDVSAAIARAQIWDAPADERMAVLAKAADLFEENAFELFALLQREAGKTLLDCVGELREAVDFLRYYGARAPQVGGDPAGVFACISPWNFPLAIFAGQIAGALSVGNGVVAKPAEATPLIADLAVRLLHKAGVPDNALILLPGTGAEVGGALSGDPRIAGLCFTGSTATAQRINRSMAAHLPTHAPLIAETGGLNAMIVDSTALPEQAVRDIVASSFQSAGQRCSACRMLYVQQDIADSFLEMLQGAMSELQVGDPRDPRTDIGPLIDSAAHQRITAHIDAARAEGRVLAEGHTTQTGLFVAPVVLRVAGIGDLGQEIFGPVLHLATFRARDLGKVIADINATGYGLTFGLHSRIDDRVEHVVQRIEAGNIYINRNQIGAIVGSQPFGGEGLSGTGPKAGGPLYQHRFLGVQPETSEASVPSVMAAEAINTAFATQKLGAASAPVELPGPTGESNRYSTRPRGRVLCLGPSPEEADAQVRIALAKGCAAVAAPCASVDGVDCDVVVSWASEARDIRTALAARDGPIVPLFQERDFGKWLVAERHVCIDTTAAGGNAALLAGADDDPIGLA